MNEAVKQKLVVGTLAVLVVGMGGYWYAARSSNANDVNKYYKAPSPKKTRVIEEESSKQTGRDRKSANIVKVTKQPRTDYDRSVGEKKHRGKRTKPEKKRKIKKAS